MQWNNETLPSMAELLCASILAKIHEQIERTDHLIGLLPAGHTDWTPEIPASWSTAMLLRHLLDCLAGLCAVLMAANPGPLAHFSTLREETVSHACAIPEARDRIARYRAHIEEGFALLRDPDLARGIPTIFVSTGEPLLSLLLGNLEHLINHKHQLFTYLKLMGVKVSTPDLYCFRSGKEKF